MDPLYEDDKPVVRTLFAITAMCLCLISCAQNPDDLTAVISFDGGETIGFLGDTLQRPIDDAATYHHKDSLLQEASTAYVADSNDLDNIIWMGRRLAYMHRFKDAIAVFTRGISIHPDAPELYRHRGHRLITLRRIDEAIRDLMKGISLSKNRDRETEADGIPNKLDIPLSNLHFNLYYHLGLAYFLKADYEKAMEAYQECMKYSDNADLRVATSDWLYLSCRRAGVTSAAQRILEPIHANMEIIENDDYLVRLLLYKGEKEPRTFSDSLSNPVAFATRLYGISCWDDINGRRLEASALRKKIIESGFWPAFGFIAAEADSARIKKNSY